MSSTKKLKILFVTPEVLPFVKSGGIADVSSALPLNLIEKGHDVRILFPKYGLIDERKIKIHEVVRLKDLKVKVGDKEVEFSIRSSFLAGNKMRVQVYLLDNYVYFGSRRSLYTEIYSGEEYKDNDERFLLLARSVFELIEKLGWVPDIIHCNDWQCGLIPLLLKTELKKKPLLSKIKILFTIHNAANQGEYPKKNFDKTNLPQEFKDEKYTLTKGKFNFLKSGIVFSDALNTVSKTYAYELCHNKDASKNLMELFKEKESHLTGILNGIDDSLWNPEKDKYIAKKYSLKNIENKQENKKKLAQKFNFAYSTNIPIVGMISKLNENKGLGLIRDCIEDLMNMEIQLIILGQGEPTYHEFAETTMLKYPLKFGCYIGYDEELSHLIEAGSDILMMPSKIEPCGLNQMYSLKYGTIPVIHKTGGLADTVKEFNENDLTGNGFVFENFSSRAMQKELRRAITVFQNQAIWRKLIENGMKENFSWVESSLEYLDIYKKLMK